MRHQDDFDQKSWKFTLTEVAFFRIRDRQPKIVVFGDKA